ncbi:hypothetical protein GLOIN_2v1474815 [Rhizophagus irregularis DAOM 181602=DAOM 197198]|uniref:Uncharacterized protein n=1 Tax=Rhizophagus irregularis (strain DAOM 181602 / DAOM 197198 / MUCL 43194) TaxID=747089 RepID=A0A2H5RHU4_RHIID|nr:hypothetical protein GLOIN_2v1474815 [Rhizophagus irregularis DAOM 181602=DAOM 197198]POG76274.1 hypothetical protein GLOIN_2v1474815 [Rhizophagus irregularis DAOM 181602=DAOM 197198]GBC17668.1 hypothetical protein GLOIN_2v1474815 [Rhizophagus irregularis DAOM 181602=DAOM 197198]|eukprot:XP_025183140.1 hypothetical protein GLOIN_2v1474815 [Rhizophagus irregularis DAOM 181602=DAOM 197198]
MSFECPQEVIGDLEKLLTDEEYEEYDVIIRTGENEKEIHAHSFILRIRSQYFRTAFFNKLYEKKDGKFIFKKPDIPPQLFETILRFIYCGKVDLTKLQGLDILKLLMVANEINIPTLIHYIQEYLTKHQYEFLQQNPIEILETVYQYETFTQLRNFCLEKICVEPDILFKSDQFISLKAPLLELFLKRDDLLMDEIIIWESLIKWCLAQHTNISQDPTQWNKEEIIIMERAIHRFIPLIRFYYISSKDFVTKVYPFREIMPKDLISNILIFRMAPDEKINVDIHVQPPRQLTNNIDSIIINQKHVAIFANWIDRKLCKFKLLYRASRDGNTNTAFHEKCDNKGATIVIVKIKNSEQIVGGYNPLNWDSSGEYKLTYDSFLFSFTDRNNFHSAKVGYSYGDVRPIGCHGSHGPIFGYSDRGKDFNFYGKTWFSDVNHCYPNVDIPKNFKADDYEVFQVNKN